MRRFTVVLAVLAVVLMISGKSYAAGSGAYRLEVPDAEATGKGSAFVGEADNPSAVYYNPAGMTQLKGENHISVGMAVIQPFVDYEPTTGDETQMRRQSFAIPHMYFVSDFGLDKVVFGLGATSSWGLGTEWAEDSFARYQATKADLFNKDVYFSTAYEVTDKLSIAVGTVYDNSYVNKKKKLLQAGTGDDGDFQLKGKAQGFGYTLSSLYKINEKHQFGLQYKSPVKEKYRGKVYLDNLNNAGATPYQAIFGGTSFSTEISSESTIPQVAILGYSYTPNDKWRFNFDVEWTDWSSTEQELISWEEELTANQNAVLNTGNPASKDWKSTMSVAVGGEYAYSEKLRIRGGYFFHETPINEENFHPNLPDSNSHSLTTGFGYDLRENLVIDASYMAMFFEKPNIDSVTVTGIDGKYKNFTQIFTVTLGYKF